MSFHLLAKISQKKTRIAKVNLTKNKIFVHPMHGDPPPSPSAKTVFSLPTPNSLMSYLNGPLILV